MSLNVHYQERPGYPEQAYSSVKPAIPALPAVIVDNAQGEWNQGITTISDDTVEVITLESSSPAFNLQDSAMEASTISDSGSLTPLENAGENHAQSAIVKIAGHDVQARASTSSCMSKAKLSWEALNTTQKVALGFSAGFSLTVIAGFIANMSTMNKDEQSHQTAVYTMVAGAIGFMLSATILRISICRSDQGHGQVREPSALA